MIDPTAYISDDILIEDEVTIGPYAVLEGSGVIKRGATIMAQSRIRNTTVGVGTTICPFAKIDECVIGDESKIGCELRKSTLGNNVHACHPTISLEGVTIHDCVNIGGGTLFAGRGGKFTDSGYEKYTLEIGSRVFVGMRTGFVPSASKGHLSVGDNVFIAADLTVRHDVPDRHTVYPTIVAKKLTAARPEIEIIYQNDDYAIMNWDKVNEEGILSGW